ncbi:MAG: hypothetical protein KDD25_07050 [Bdellovibrionales bacterium]|nr:hypothetical protein [Bdellovibrionales bacterium]
MKNILLLLVVIGLCPTFVYAASAYEDDYEGASYEDILKELSGTGRTRSTAQGEDPFTNVQFHVGAAIVNSNFSIHRGNDQSIQASLRGFQATLGIDLFDPDWIAEGVIRSYNSDEYEDGKVSANEFDIRVKYLQSLTSFWKLSYGVGLGAKYIDVEWAGGADRNYQSPSSVFAFGANAYLSRKFSIGGEFAARSPLTGDTPDSTALEISLRLDGHF